MKLALQKRQEISSATITQTLGLVLVLSVLLALTASASDPSWWSSRGAVVAPQIVTNNGVVTTNYIPNNYAVVTQGQLKQFTSKAVQELNADFTNGAGTNLNTMVSNWAADYTTNNYNATNLKPSDYTVMTVGQLKYIGNQVWSQLVAGGYTNAVPSWLARNTNSDNAAANLGQLKELFNFNLSTSGGTGGGAPTGVPQITGYATITAGVNVPITYAIVASNNPTGYAASGLPTGLSINASSGVISGTPTTAGVYNISVSASNSVGAGTGFVVFNIVQSSAAPAINSATAVIGQVSSPIAYQITASNNPSQFGATGLPNGLTLDVFTGVISGTVTTPGTYPINLSATNESGTGTTVLNLAINTSGGSSSNGPQPAITSSLSASAPAGQSFRYCITASNSPTNYGAIGLPDGLSINPSTGVINGTPTTGGVYSLIISATNSAGTTSALLSLTVSAITSPLTDSATMGSPYSYTITATISSPSLTVSTLPEGLAFSASTGVISGTPTQTGTFNITIQATGSGLMATANLALTVGATASTVPVITSSITDNAIVGQYYVYAITAQNGPTNYNATWEGSTTLPAGLVLDSTNGTISGSPTTAGTYTLNLTASNAQGSGTAPMTLTVTSLGTGVAPAPIITSPEIAYANVGSAFSYMPAVSNGTASFSASGLPTNFIINPTTGVISGTPSQAQAGASTVTISAMNSLGTTTMPLLLVIQSGNSSITATLVLQAGISPSANYQTITAGIATDSTQPSLATQSTGSLLVGMSSSTQQDRTLLGFDLSPLPPGAIITSATLIVNAEPTTSTSSTDIYTLELDQAVTPFAESTVSWTSNGGYEPNNILSSISANLPTSPTLETWPSSANFIAAVQAAYQNGNDLDLLLWSPTIESGTNANYFNFDDNGSGNPPELLVCYTTSAPPVIAAPPAAITTGSAVSYQMVAANTNSSTTYTVTSGSLPTGLTLSSTGLLTGTPTLSGNYTFTITATNGNGSTSTTFTISVGAVPVITSSLTTTAAPATAFNYTITASNSPTSFFASNLPTGLTIDPSTGIISGTPTSYATAYVTIGASNAIGTSTARQLTITFPPTFNGPLAASGNLAIPFNYSVPTTSPATSFTATGTTSLTSLGLTVSSSGNITGTPTATGTYAFTVTAANAAGSSAPATMTITIAGTPVLSLADQSDSADVNTSYGSFYTATYNPPLGNESGSPSFSYAVTSGSAPTGLTIDAYGDIYGQPETGTPTGLTDTVGVTVTDGFGNAATATFTFVIYSGPGFASSLIDQLDTDDTGYVYQLQTQTGTEVDTQVTNLPAGLTYNPVTEQISEIDPGVSPAPGVYNIGLSATDAADVTSTATLVLTISPSTITSPSTATAEVGVPFSFTVTDNDTASNFQAVNLPPATATNPFVINPVTGVITGTPVAADTVPINLTVTDPAGTHTQTLLLTITPNPGDAQIAFQQGVSPTSAYTVPSAVVKADSQNPAIANQTFSASNTLTVGATTATASSRAMLAFNLSALPPNATIVSASLVVNTSSGSSAGVPLVVEVHQSGAAFSPGSATWTSNGGYDSSVLESLILDPSVSAPYTFPLSSALAQAVELSYSSSSVLYLTLAAPEAEQGGISDYIGLVTNASNPQQNPELMVTYTLGTPGAPVVTSTTTVTGTVNVPVNYTITASNNPQHFAATNLPSGLALPNSTTATISGTVTNICSTVATVSASNSTGTGSKAVTFNIDSATPATSLQVVSGNNQAGYPSTLLAQPLVVQANPAGTPLLVTFSVPPGQGGFAATNSAIPPFPNTLTVPTNGNTPANQATVYFFLPNTPRTTTIIASAGTAQPASLVETSTLNGSSTSNSLVLLSVLSGEGQSGPVGQTLAEPFVVQATNGSGQPVSGQSLSLNVAQGGGAISTTASGSFSGSSSITTDNFGKATIYLQPGSSDPNGINKVSVSASAANGIVYLTALTGSTASSTPTPGGGTTPALDPDPSPTASVGGEPISLLVSASPSDPTDAIVYWGHLTGATSYIVQRLTNDNQGQGWVVIATTEAGLVNDEGRLGGVRYQYRVIAVDAQGNQSQPSSIVSYELPVIKTFWVQGVSYFGTLYTPPANWVGFSYNGYDTDDDGPYVFGGYSSADSTFGPDGFDAFDVSYAAAGKYGSSSSNYKFTAFTCPSQTLQWYEVVAPSTGNPIVYKTRQWQASGGDSPVYNLDPTQSGVVGSYYLTPAEQITAYDSTCSSSNSTVNSGSPELQLDSVEKTTIGGTIPQNGVGTFSISDVKIAGAQYHLAVTQTGGFIVADNQGSIGGNFNLTESTLGQAGAFTVSANPSSMPKNGATVTITVQAMDSAGNSLGTDSVKYTYQGANSNDLTIPVDEASGPKYRKIALNGLPMADEKPQQSAESDQEKEETYVDALTLGLRHSTTDAYLPVSGSDFSVSARRDFRSQVWNSRRGLRPHEQPDLPFGMCWSSNLAPNIKFSHNNDPTNSTTPDQAIVTDETGAVHTFCRWYDAAGNVQFFPMPTAKNEAQIPNLETLSINNSAIPPTYIFTRKYGATLTYEATTLVQKISNDRKLGSLYSTTYLYARLVQAVDRVGNTVNYQFQGTSNLIPETITVANQPSIKLSIEQTPISTILSNSNLGGSAITAIWDANGNKTSYTYTSAPGDSDAVVLQSVTTPDGANTQYSYDSQPEADQTPVSASDPGSIYTYADLSSIQDPLGNKYAFTYNFDHSKLNYMSNPQVYTGYYTESGCPRNVTTVTMPDGTSSSFANNSLVWVQNASPPQTGLALGGHRINTVTDATKNFTRTYTFGDADVVPLPSFPQSAKNITQSMIVAYQSLNVAYEALGSETFQFDINAAMALKQIIDFSGNHATFAHTDAWSAPSTYLQIIFGATLNGFYDDPTQQTDALGNCKTFTYDPPTRIMTDIVDENKNHTHYDIDSVGRRTTEKLFDSSSNLIQETDFTYGNSAYPGFMTKKCVKTLGGNDPSWAHALITQYLPDANGRVAQEIVDPNGLDLVTSYTYDANGNKLTAVDPKGNTTWFSYDSRNRLITVTNADGSQKQMVYDVRGNKIKEYDENGIATLYQYDSLNRLIEQARDMNGNGIIDAGTDLITSYTYDAVNDKLSSTDPKGGVTTMVYDNLQRVTQITDALSHVTQFTYGANSGGNAFDRSSFKPTHTVDPRGFKTDVTYDALYRPITKAVQYDTAQAPSTTSTQYDAVGNTIRVTDPLGHQTGTSYDALNRPLVTTYADGSSSQQAYTSTGFKWQVTDPNGHIAQTVYDNAGRAISVTQGVGTAAAATTSTIYDAAGNAVETINPLGNKWDYAYDARNRKVQEFEPSVLDQGLDSPNVNKQQRPTMTWVYDQGGRTIAAIDARGNDATTLYKTVTDYDAANRVVEVDEPAVTAGTPIVKTTYDNNSNVLTVTDPNGHITTNCYDALNRLLTTTDALGIKVTNTYDQMGNKLTVADGLNQTTTFTYDGVNRNLTVTDAAGNVTTLKYDAMNKTQRVDALGQTTSYLYDVRNRLSNVVYASSVAANSQRNYAYDNVGNLLSVTEPNQTAANVAYSYDALNRAVTETSSGLTHVYGYDAAGNRIQTLYGAAGVSTPTTSTATRILTSSYDALNRLLLLQDQTPAEFAASTVGRSTSYGYDLNGNIAAKTLPNGDAESTQFDVLNRATVQSAQTRAASSLYSYSYGYDLVGNVTSVAESYPSGLGDRTVSNTYDSINRLLVEAVSGTASVTTTYVYDNANNRTSKAVSGGASAGTTTYTYNNLNQLTGYTDTGDTRSVALTYDLDGNRATRVVTGGSDNGTDTYGYDFENRLIGLDKGTAGGTGTYAYTYDYRTRRIVRDESAASGVVTDLVFSGGTSVQEYGGSIASSNLVVEYVRGSDYGGGVGGILYTIRGGNERYTHENKRGDVVAKTDSNGTLKYQAQYEAFGKQVATSGSTEDRQKSNSKDTDPTNLVDEGFRYRDLETGMFISRDPAGFIDGPNEYTYVVQNPWTKFDPEGLEGIVQAPEIGIGATVRLVEDIYKVVDRGVEDAAASPAGRAVESFAGREASAAVQRVESIDVKALPGLVKDEVQATERGAEIVKNDLVGSKPPETKIEGKPTGLGPNDPPQRYQGPWTPRDLARAQDGKGPLDMVPTKDKNGTEVPLQLHHGDQQPGAGVHEVSPPEHANPDLHPNSNQGVTPEMRKDDRELHWQMRGQEQGNPPPPSSSAPPSSSPAPSASSTAPPPPSNAPPPKQS